MGRTKRGKGRSMKKRGHGASSASAGNLRAPADSLRFRIGSRVECCVDSRDDGEWVTATVVKLFYDTEMDYGIVPYQFQCDDGLLRFAPRDSEEYVRPSNSPPMPIKFAPGTRVSFKFCQTWDWQMGTVLSTNVGWAEDVRWGTGKDIMAEDSPYKIRIDDGLKDAGFYGPEQWIRFSAPPFPVKYNQNARVECKMKPKEHEWRLGTVISSDKDWLETEDSPYFILFDDGTDGNFYGPEENIREIPLRFKVGDRVDLGRWAGTVVKLWATQGQGEDAYKVPYEIRLDDGSCVVSRLDTDEYVTASKVPPLNIKYSKGTRVECKMKDAVWRQGTVVKSNKDWAEHDRPRYYIRFVGDDGEPQYEGFWGPDDCIRECTLFDVTAGFKHLSMFDREDADDDLFAPPPLRSDCPICFIPLPIECDEYHDSPCCGNTICNGCLHSLLSHESESSRACPFCRAPLERNGDQILTLSRQRIELNDPEVTFCMGCHYSSGWYGLPKDEKKAFDLYLRAAELGSARACTNVSIYYGAGKFVEKNEARQRYYLEKAAKLGEVRARYGLGVLDADKGNIELALRHFKIAAVQGFSHSLTYVLGCYQVGLLSKEEYADILRANQKAKAMEWSKARDRAREQLIKES